ILLLSSVKKLAENGRTLLLEDQDGIRCGGVFPSQKIDSCKIQAVLDAQENEADSFSINLFKYPHDVIRFNQRDFNSNLEHLIREGDYSEIRDGVFVGPKVHFAETTVVDCSDGPILIDEHSKIGPFSYLAGPIKIGANCKIAEHSAIKDYVFLCDTVKAGGEIEATVIESFSNKQHHGFLGHSYLGSWINLGAGTCNSDLKNTYGKVNAEYHGQRISTGMQFVGCFVGDYSKSAINTSIFTGKSIGVCSMLYGFITQNVPSFVNYAPSIAQQITEVTHDVMVTTQKRMFDRRKVVQQGIHRQLLKDVFELTRPERDGLSIEAGPIRF
ncbi:MAG: glucose-1-phosphate thymidylyltransferase, partial [Planctomycetota bacterium]